jgi:hypothetical protein
MGLPSAGKTYAALIRRVSRFSRRSRRERRAEESCSRSVCRDPVILSPFQSGAVKAVRQAGGKIEGLIYRDCPRQPTRYRSQEGWWDSWLGTDGLLAPTSGRSVLISSWRRSETGDVMEVLRHRTPSPRQRGWCAPTHATARRKCWCACPEPHSQSQALPPGAGPC